MKGKKTGGRQKGSPNRLTASVKDALHEAFAKLGGVSALVTWAKSDPAAFYGLWVKLLPRSDPSATPITVTVINGIDLSAVLGQSPGVPFERISDAGPN